MDRILLIQETERFTSLSILSEDDGEGKTFVTAALAVAYATRFQRKVLVIDTSNPVAIDTPSPAKALKKVNLLAELLEPVNEIDVIPLRDWSGAKKTPRGNVDEYQVKALLDQVGTTYALVLVDTSSLGRRNRNNFDPVLIARQTGAAILVTTGGQMDPEISIQNRKRIADAKINLIGAVYNQGIAEGT